MISLNFEHPAKHSLKQLEWIEGCLLKTKKWRVNDALRMAHQLVVHDHQSSKLFLKKLGQLSDSTLLQDKLNQLSQLNNLVQKYHSSSIRKDEDIFVNLYDPNIFQYLEGRIGTSNLLIIFTTIYNNFGVSNLLLYSILKKRDCSILFVKDPTYGCYMANTIGGCNLNQLTLYLQEFAQKKCAGKNILIMGYSSSGYAAWYAAMKLGANKFLGFSLATDLSSGTVLPTDSYLKPNIKILLDSSQLLNLKLMISENPSLKSKLVVGELEHVDVLHAKNMSGLKGVDIEFLPKIFHDTPEAAIRLELFEGYLDWLLT